MLFLIFLAFFSIVLFFIIKYFYFNKFYNLIYIDSIPKMESFYSSFYIDNCKIETLSKISLDARILNITKYENSNFDDNKFVPYDIVLGWNNLTKKEYLENIEISQSNRYFYYQYKNLKHELFLDNFDNFHIINNEYIEKNKDLLKKYSNINIEGYLVNVQCPTWSRKTSLSFSDRSQTSCEQLYITNISKIY